MCNSESQEVLSITQSPCPHHSSYSVINVFCLRWCSFNISTTASSFKKDRNNDRRLWPLYRSATQPEPGCTVWVFGVCIESRAVAVLSLQDKYMYKCCWGNPVFSVTAYIRVGPYHQKLSNLVVLPCWHLLCVSLVCPELYSGFWFSVLHLSRVRNIINTCSLVVNFQDVLLLFSHMGVTQIFYYKSSGDVWSIWLGHVCSHRQPFWKCLGKCLKFNACLKHAWDYSSYGWFRLHAPL